MRGVSIGILILCLAANPVFAESGSEAPVIDEAAGYEPAARETPGLEEAATSGGTPPAHNLPASLRSLELARALTRSLPYSQLPLAETRVEGEAGDSSYWRVLIPVLLTVAVGTATLLLFTVRSS